MKKILFLHGFFATGSCPMANAMREAFEGCAVVLTPDLPLHPKEALKEIRSIIDKEHPDLLVGNSCGAFLAQMLSPVVGIPALLGNPYFKMTEFLKVRIGEHQYKAPRKDGNQRLVIDEALIEEFPNLKPYSLIAATHITKNEYGDFLVSRTPLLTSPHCLWSTTTISIISWRSYSNRTRSENLVRTACYQDVDGVSSKRRKIFPTFQRWQVQVHQFCI